MPEPRRELGINLDSAMGEPQTCWLTSGKFVAPLVRGLSVGRLPLVPERRYEDLRKLRRDAFADRDVAAAPGGLVVLEKQDDLSSRAAVDDGN